MIISDTTSHFLAIFGGIAPLIPTHEVTTNASAGNIAVTAQMNAGNAYISGNITAGNVISQGTLAYESITVDDRLVAFTNAVEYEANGAIAHNSSLVHINANADVARAYTIDAAVAGELLVIKQIDADTNNRTVTLNAGNFDGANNVLTFNAADEAVVLLGIDATFGYVILHNHGGVSKS